MTTVLDALNAALHRACADDDRVVILGEDVLDPYGGAFKVTRGLSTTFPEQVKSTPISEAGIVGVAAGMALRGLRPVVEIMFGDFITLAADQLVNHAAKFRWMYNDQVRVPVVIRTPMGGRRGYGPTHSQTLEKLFLGVPGLRVLAPTTLGEPGELLYRAIMETEDPLLFVENKLLYLQPVLDTDNLEEFSWRQINNDGLGSAPSYVLTIQGAPSPELTISTYGYMAEIARQAMLRLAYEDEIFVELAVTTQLAPTETLPIIASASHTTRLLTVEEGTLTLGWGSEVLAQCSEALGGILKATQRLAASEVPVPASGPLEAAALPGVEEIIQAARRLMVR